jgi:hypothetical protein
MGAGDAGIGVRDQIPADGQLLESTANMCLDFLNY